MPVKFLRELHLRRKLGPPIVVVSGLPRSGTSMMMNMLRAAQMEIVTDEERTADEDNPKGYFEDERVKDLDKMDDKTWLVACRGKVIKVISFLLPSLPEDHHYKVIFMRRPFEEVIASQNKMLKRRGEPVGTPEDDAAMMSRYTMHLRKVEFLLEEEPYFQHLDVPYHEVLADPKTWAAKVARFIGGNRDVAAMSAVVDEALYRNRSKAGAGV